MSIYFGMADPPAGFAPPAAADVVLEPYHPSVKYGGFADLFPSANRWVYVNPTSVDPWQLEHSVDRPPLSGVDERWRLPRLDHDHPAALDWAVARAIEAWHLDDGRSTGLFVDDFDRLLPDRAETARAFLDRVADATAPTGPAWFVNRGIGIWHDIDGLAAVLLEDVAPQIVPSMSAHEQRWLADEVLPAVEQVRTRGVRVHALSYDDQEAGEMHPDPGLADDLAALIDTTTTGAKRSLDEWRLSR
ncbi:hypothetical protein [uncultured Amnibacterium sp.]|uniref:hypothetical protein n=1 Tax=uncultured Amnibacterium sp. TaxID=1631851 RepID=UPI0035CABBCE